MKRSRLVKGVQLLEFVADSTVPAILGLLQMVAARAGLFNMVVTNVPGPQAPLYMLGSRLLATYPLVPLFNNQGVGVALFSYDGRLYWGLNADRGVVPDPHDFMECLSESFDELCQVAGLSSTAAVQRRPVLRPV